MEPGENRLLENENTFAAAGQIGGGATAARSATDDDHLEMVCIHIPAILVTRETRVLGRVLPARVLIFAAYLSTAVRSEAGLAIIKDRPGPRPVGAPWMLKTAAGMRGAM